MSAARKAWLEHAKVWLESGCRYASRLNQRLLRAASVLPALIGEDTVALLLADPAGTDKVKVTRKEIRRAAWRACWWPKKLPPA